MATMQPITIFKERNNLELLPLLTLVLLPFSKGHKALKSALIGLYLAAVTMYFDISNAMDVSDRFGRSVKALAYGPFEIWLYWLLLLVITLIQVFIYINRTNKKG